MNDQNEKLIISTLESYKPQPGRQFYHRMASSPWNRKRPMPQSMFSRRFAIGFAAFMIVAIALSMSIPTVRAAVLKYLGLNVSSSESISNPAIPAESLVDSQKVEEISNLAGWKIKVPSWLPEGYKFYDTVYDSPNKMAILTFLATRQLPGNDPTMTETKAITMVQALHNDILPLMVAPSTFIHDISINGQPAAYAVGAWENNAATGKATWNNSNELQNVYWQIDKVYLTLNSNDTLVNQDDLIQIAESTK
jgi:hypothetical protein